MAAGSGMGAVRLARARRQTRRRRGEARRWRVLALGVESAALLSVALIAALAWLGRFAAWFGGAGLWAHLLPFAGAVLGLGLAAGALLRLWIAARRSVCARLPAAPAAVALAAAAAAVWFAGQPSFQRELGNLRALVGGQAEAERVAIAHQVYAAYRRGSLPHVQRMLERARPFASLVDEAAAAFGVDPEVLMGIAAAESSFRPRRSADGGRGLFQITAPPQAALDAARHALGTPRVDLVDHRHNAFVGAATLRAYLDQMRGDLFLALLAYNIGPKNGGLRAIMAGYGARDFVTIQPYLQELPRDYPIRVLAAALAYRLWRREGRLPRYEEGDNAQRIQHVGIPGLG